MLDGMRIIETEERNCVYCGTAFRVAKTSTQDHHSYGCKLINGPKDRTWGGTMRQQYKKRKSKKKPIETHDEYGRLR